MSDADDEVRRTATALAVPRQTLSKIHTKFGAIATEEDRLGELVPKGVCNLKAKLIDVEIKEVTKNMAERQREGDNDGVLEAMKRLVELNDMKKRSPNIWASVYWCHLHDADAPRWADNQWDLSMRPTRSCSPKSRFISCTAIAAEPFMRSSIATDTTSFLLTF